MTVVAGVVHHGRCYLAGDTLISAGDERTPNALRKTRRCSGIVLGASGDLSAVSVVLRGRWVPRWTGDAPDGDWMTVGAYVAERLQPALTGLLRGVRGDVDLLLGVGGQLWYVSKAGEHAYPAGYAAVGTGAAWAVGALGMVRHMRPRPRPHTALRWAVAEAERGCAAVGGWGGVVSA